MLKEVAKVFRLDGWFNILTGLGLKNKDKRVNADVEFVRMTETDAENLYSADDIAGKVVDRIPDDGIRNWIEYENAAKEVEAEIENEFKRLHFRERLLSAWIWARLYGGGAILPIVNDGQPMNTPLVIERVKRIENVLDLTSWELIPSGKTITDPRMADFGLPASYNIYTRGGGSSQVDGFEIHHTRVIRIEGVRLPKMKFQANNYWGDSILNKTKNAIRNYAGAFDSAAGLPLDYRQLVIKMPGLAAKVAAGQEEQVKNRIDLLNMTRSVLNAVLLDTDEEFEQKTYSLAGVPEILKQTSARLVAAVDMPHTIVLGEGGSGGLGNEGVSEKKDYFSKVAQAQESKIRRPIERMIELIQGAQAFVNKTKIDPTMTFKFRPLEIESEKEIVEKRELQSRADAAYISAGVLMPEEVAVSRFGGAKYSIETTLDKDRIEDGDADPAADPSAKADSRK